MSYQPTHLFERGFSRETKVGSTPENPYYRKAAIKKGLYITALVVGILGLAACGAGFAIHQGLLPAGGLTNLHQVILMAGSGVGGAILISAGVVGLIKRRRSEKEIEGSLLTRIRCRGEQVENASSNCKAEEIDDLVYTNPELGFAFVVDGTGHENARMRTALMEHFDAFTESYIQGRRLCETEDDLKAHFENKMQELHLQFQANTPLNRRKVCTEEKEKNQQASISELDKQAGRTALDEREGTFSDESGTYKPAMSFVQLVPQRGKLSLLIAQADDTMVVVERDGKLEVDRGLLRKAQVGGVGHMDKLHTTCIDITGATRVIGLSDGIGEFITFDRLQQEVIGTSSRELFDKLKGAVMFSNEQAAEVGANGRTFKKYDSADETHRDDMGLFVLDILPA